MGGYVEVIKRDEVGGVEEMNSLEFYFIGVLFYGRIKI